MHEARPSADMTSYTFATTIVSQCVLCISLVTACIPCLKPFLDAFHSGMLNVSMKSHNGESSNNSAGNTYALVSLSRGAKESANRSRYIEDEIEVLGISAAAFAVTAPVKPFNESQSTRGIHRTDHWSISYETGERKSTESVTDVSVSDVSGSRTGHPL